MLHWPLTSRSVLLSGHWLPSQQLWLWILTAVSHHSNLKHAACWDAPMREACCGPLSSVLRSATRRQRQPDCNCKILPWLSVGGDEACGGHGWLFGRRRRSAKLSRNESRCGSLKTLTTRSFQASHPCHNQQPNSCVDRFQPQCCCWPPAGQCCLLLLPAAAASLPACLPTCLPACLPRMHHCREQWAGTNPLDQPSSG